MRVLIVNALARQCFDTENYFVMCILFIIIFRLY